MFKTIFRLLHPSIFPKKGAKGQTSILIGLKLYLNSLTKVSIGTKMG
jgi:hypothetical protein